MSPTVTVTHWDPEMATAEPPPEIDGTLETFNERHGGHRVLPVCPKCRGRVERYDYPQSPDKALQIILPEWADEVLIALRPCNHRVPPEWIGLHVYGTQSRLVASNAPRP